MTDDDAWRQVSAACGDCGAPVFFDQVGPRSFLAVCTENPEHPIGTLAQRVLDQLRRDNRARPGPAEPGPPE